jgi:phosphatidate cytidylyltransferase
MYMFGVAYIWAMPVLDTMGLTLFLVVLMLCAFVGFVVGHAALQMQDLFAIIFGVLYVPFLFGFLILIRQAPFGEIYVWFVFLAAWGSDTCAYFVGKFLGRRKLAPVLSPNKTVEGSIGGVFGGVCLSLAYAYVVQVWTASHTSLWQAVCCGGVGAISAQIGDLAASAIKRKTGVKDYGALFPGHGGVLDRFDSVLFTAPVIYIILYIIK